VHAQWWAEGEPPPTQHTLTFNSSGGSPVEAGTAAAGTAVSEPAAPTRLGYIFQGWYNAASGGTRYSWPHTLSANITMHAQWTVNPNSLGITLTINDFSSLSDPAGSAFSDTSFTLTKPGGTRTISVSGADNNAVAVWYVGLAKIYTGDNVTLYADNLSLGDHTLRVTAKFGGKLYSKEITFTVQN
jgi:uncharacterized repeat protein (TIGR02543 family)